MGKLKSLKLKIFFEMNDVEMKNIVGGYGQAEINGHTETITCYGECKSIPGGVECYENGNWKGCIFCLGD
jgi:hypothetical protein